MASESGKAEQYFTRAEELRVLAEAMTSIEARAHLLEIAQHYARLAAALLKFGARESSLNTLPMTSGRPIISGHPPD